MFSKNAILHWGIVVINLFGSKNIVSVRQNRAQLLGSRENIFYKLFPRLPPCANLWRRFYVCLYCD